MMFSSLVLILVSMTRHVKVPVLGLSSVLGLSLAQVGCLLLAAASFALSNVLIVEAQGGPYGDLTKVLPWPRYVRCFEVKNVKRAVCTL